VSDNHPHAPCDACLANVREIDRLNERQQELLATIVRVTNSTPFSDEAKDALDQRGKLVAAIGTLRSQLATMTAARDELADIAGFQVRYRVELAESVAHVATAEPRVSELLKELDAELGRIAELHAVGSVGK
jgi:hypothetical protein